MTGLVASHLHVCMYIHVLGNLTIIVKVVCKKDIIIIVHVQENFLDS